MDYTSDPLWHNIRDFSFDEPSAALPFSKKLAKEQHWHDDFTDSAITEYRKFIYLCCISPTGASPSKVVDEVWHLHLTYTVNYWIKFCKETLHKDIHHHPSEGGSNEKEKHNTWYRNTIQLYRNTFNTEPPQTIWPSPPSDFVIPHANDGPEQKTFNNKLFFLLFIPFGVIAILYGQPVPFLLSGPHYLVFYTILIGIIIFIAYNIRLVRKHNFLSFLSIAGNPLNKYKLAFLTGGYNRYILLCLSELIREEVLIHKKKDIYKVDKEKARYSTNELSLELADHEKENISYKEIQLLIRSKSDSELKNLRDLKVRHSDKRQNIAIGLIVAIFSMPRFGQAMSNDKPATILGFIFFIAIVVLMGMLRNSFHYFAERFLRKNSAYTANINDDIASRIIFSGVAGIAGIYMFNHLNTRHYNFNNDSGSGGCSSSGCGSSCGGGGCGGCGGD